MEQENTAVVEWVDIVDEKNEVVAHHMGHLHYSQKKSRKYAGLLP